MTAPEFATATEREALCGFLDLQRAALIRKVQGVSNADARKPPTASSLSLLGLLKHCALWERRWFQNIVAGRSFPGEFRQFEASTRIWRSAGSQESAPRDNIYGRT